MLKVSKQNIKDLIGDDKGELFYKVMSGQRLVWPRIGERGWADVEKNFGTDIAKILSDAYGGQEISFEGEIKINVARKVKQDYVSRTRGKLSDEQKERRDRRREKYKAIRKISKLRRSLRGVVNDPWDDVEDSPQYDKILEFETLYENYVNAYRNGRFNNVVLATVETKTDNSPLNVKSTINRVDDKYNVYHYYPHYAGVIEGWGLTSSVKGGGNPLSNLDTLEQAVQVVQILHQIDLGTGSEPHDDIIDIVFGYLDRQFEFELPEE